MSRFTWITTPEQLSPLIAKWRQLSCLYLDTEFQRERTFYPQLALIQLSDGEQHYLIEPQAARAELSFSELLADPQVRKVFHSASEDCEVLFRYFNVVLRGLFDTQIAAAYLGLGPSMGYAAMVESLCGVRLAKGWSRSDWLQRPLSDEQLNYAVDDVEYLVGAYQQIQALIAKAPEKQTWITQECQELESRVEALDDYSLAYLDVKNAWRLNAEQLQRLYYLCRWREVEARQSDRPKTFVLKNDELFELARQGLTNGRLPFIEGWHPASRRRYGDTLQALLSNISEQPEVDLLAPLSPKYWQSMTQSMQLMRRDIDKVAAELKIEPEVLCSKKLLRRYVAYLLDNRREFPRGWTKLHEQFLSPVIKSHLNT
ncbi:MAG: ribonuclease D [Gammaproteobacteria bacterium]|nr:ribonuclease D [Gammaproteobacteria bacterium]NVK88689.1 ribonuclease D [Gammaproteobacteria bacterium]